MARLDSQHAARADANPQLLGPWFHAWTDNDSVRVYLCAAYDDVNQTCGDYENRPAVCRKFPTPGLIETMLDLSEFGERDGADCSFWLDVPGWAARKKRPLLPLTVLTR
jgi:Fe-S-cluster containining protein